MDAGSGRISSSSKTQSRCPLQEQFLQRRNARQNLDRFIPNRSAIDFDYAHYMLTKGRKGKENPAVSSPSSEAYQKQLAETFNMNRTRILAFKNKPPIPVEAIPYNFSSSVHQSKPTKPRRYIPQTSERTLDAPDLVDDYYLNLLDWGSSNVLAIALGNTFYQQELKKLQQQIDMLQNTNRYLTGEGCSLNAKELEQMENRLEQGIARIKSKKEEMILGEIESSKKRLKLNYGFEMIRRV